MRADRSHRRQSDDGLSRAARQHHDAAAAGCFAVAPPGCHRIALVRTQVGAQRDVREGCSGFEAGFVGGGPTSGEQCLLQRTTVRLANRKAMVIEASVEQLGDAADLRQLVEDQRVVGHQHEPVGHTRQPDPSVSADHIFDLADHTAGDRIL